MAKWTIGNYNRFIGAARRARPGLSVKEARTTYRRFAERLGHPAFQTDIKNHPRIFSQESKVAQLQRAEEIIRSGKILRFRHARARREREEDEWEVGGKADYAEE